MSVATKKLFDEAIKELEGVIEFLVAKRGPRDAQCQKLFPIEEKLKIINMRLTLAEARKQEKTKTL